MTAREELERAVEEAIALLDALDVDDDLEPNGDDELSVQWPVWNRRA